MTRGSEQWSGANSGTIQQYKEELCHVTIIDRISITALTHIITEYRQSNGRMFRGTLNCQWLSSSDEYSNGNAMRNSGHCDICFDGELK